MAKDTSGFSAEEKAAMKERAKELKNAASKAEAAAQVDEKLAELSPAERAMATRVHELVLSTVPELQAKLWYGMPAYYLDGTMIVFFQSAEKFKTRYSTLGFSDKALLDDGGMWPNAYALTEVSKAVESQIAALVLRAVGR